MLIKVLNDYYDILASAGKTCPEGFDEQSVSYKIMLRPDGTISDILDIRTPSAADKKGKVSYLPVDIVLPSRTQKPGIDFNIIEHRPLYIFGLNYEKGEFTAEDKTNKAKKSHECFVKGNLEFTEGMSSEIVLAYRNFMEKWDPEAEIHNVHLTRLGKDYSKGYFCFALDGHPDVTLHDMNGEIMQKIKSAEKSADDEKTVCSISGEEGAIARIHDKIKGVKGGQAAGGLLVCFNSSAEESYGKEQSFNSGITQKVMKHYTQALNILLKDKNHRIYLDDMTIVFWAMAEDDKNETDLLMSMLGGDGADAAETDLMLKEAFSQLREGRKTDLSSFGVDAGVTFCMAGLAPNNSRISQKFIYRDKFGKIFKNAVKHQYDMALEGAKGQIPLWQMFKELKSPKSTNEKTPPPMMAAVFKAVLTGSKYPDSLLETAVRRVKIDREVNYVRAGIIKACINRKETGEIEMALDRENTNLAYLCGRLFAALERIQRNAAEGELNRTIKDTYFSSACSNPAAVFPRLMKLAQYHLAKDGYAKGDSILLGEITDKLEGEFPKTLPLDEQGKFILGYYHQYQSFFAKKSDN